MTSRTCDHGVPFHKDCNPCRDDMHAKTRAASQDAHAALDRIRRACNLPDTWTPHGIAVHVEALCRAFDHRGRVMAERSVTEPEDCVMVYWADDGNCLLSVQEDGDECDVAISEAGAHRVGSFLMVGHEAKHAETMRDKVALRAALERVVATHMAVTEAVKAADDPGDFFPEVCDNVDAHRYARDVLERTKR